MKVFISADIEGITTTTFWPETSKGEQEYGAHAEQMTQEVAAACEGAFEAGADEIVVRDAHEYGNNIDIQKLPEGVTLIRGWSGHPYGMVYGLDKSFDAAFFIGYHSPASCGGNPLSHTESLAPLYVKLNGTVASEFMIYSYAALLEEVPAVFLSGDKALCEAAKELYPDLRTCAVKEGVGAATINYNPKTMLGRIREGAREALRKENLRTLPVLPKDWTLEICYKDHADAEKFSYYPGVRKISDNTIEFQSRQYFEILRAFCFLFN